LGGSSGASTALAGELYNHRLHENRLQEISAKTGVKASDIKSELLTPGNDLSSDNKDVVTAALIGALDRAGACTSGSEACADAATNYVNQLAAGQPTDLFVASPKNDENTNLYALAYAISGQLGDNLDAPENASIKADLQKRLDDAGSLGVVDIGDLVSAQQQKSDYGRGLWVDDNAVNKLGQDAYNQQLQAWQNSEEHLGVQNNCYICVDGDQEAKDNQALSLGLVGVSSLLGSGAPWATALSDAMANKNAVSALEELQSGDIPKLNAFDLDLSKTVENHLGDISKSGAPARPYGDSRLLMQQIMDSAQPIPDPGGVPGALRWDAPGTMNGSSGTYELVVGPNTKTVLHFQFKGG
jgi:hypothetical protein